MLRQSEQKWDSPLMVLIFNLFKNLKAMVSYPYDIHLLRIHIISIFLKDGYDMDVDIGSISVYFKTNSDYVQH